MKSFAFLLSLVAGGYAQLLNNFRMVPYHKQLARVPSDIGGEQAVFDVETVRVEGANWVRVFFDQAATDVADVSNEEGSQVLSAADLKTWDYSSAYFNGAEVKVELIGGKSSSVLSAVVSEVQVDAGMSATSICNQEDQRELSQSARAARMFPTGCSVWLINDAKHCFLSAGHCDHRNNDLIQFNVPLSDSRGTVRQPLPQDQYPVDRASIQSSQGTGKDWMYFGVFPNTNGDSAYDKQKSHYELMPLDQLSKIAVGQNLTITGYGTARGDRNQVQQTHTGAIYVVKPDHNEHALGYRVDTTPGNSGSAIEHESGYVIGIHTLGGCYYSQGIQGYNAGTLLSSPGLVKALKSPRGVCK